MFPSVSISLTFLVCMVGANNLPSGVIIDSDSCSPQQVSTIQQALAIANQQAAAGIAAQQSRAQRNLFEFIFRPNDRTIVKNALTKVQNYIAGQGETVAYICKDLTQRCGRPAATAYYIGEDMSATKVPPALNRVVLCPQFFNRPLAPDPCDQSSLEIFTPVPGVDATQTYQSTMVLHEMLHIPYMAGPMLAGTQDLAKPASQIHDLLDLQAAGYQVPADRVATAIPRYNTDSYTYLAAWAWMMNQQQDKCPSAYPLWNVLNQGLPANRNELRRLLGEDTSTSAIDIYPGREDGVVECSGDCSLANPPTTTFPSFNITGVDFSLVHGIDFSSGAPVSGLTDVNGTRLTLQYAGP